MVSILLVVLNAYLVLGLVFAGPFVLIGVGKVDAAARSSGWGFRMIVIPGVVALWPLLAWRWWSGRTRIERTAHRAAAGGKQS